MTLPRPVQPGALRLIVGRRVRAIRKEAGARQVDVATAARAFGLPWPASKVAALEVGAKCVSAEELLLLPAVLTAALGRPVGYADLFDDDADVRLSPAVVVAARDVPALLAGCDSPFALAAAGGGGNTWWDESAWRVARSLEVDRQTLIDACARLYGRSLSAERDARAAELLPADAPRRTVQAKRGRITRDLEREIRESRTSQGAGS